MVKNILLIGATGLTGSLLLDELLSDEQVDLVIAPTRRELKKDSPKFQNILFQEVDELDFSDMQVDCLISCFGTTAKKAGSAKKFEEVENHFMQTLLIKARQAEIPHMALMSSFGAGEKFPGTYLRVKGEIEQFARSMSFDSLYIFRPSALVGDRQESRPLEKLGVSLFNKLNPISRPFLSFWPVDAGKVARTMKKLSLHPRPGQHLIDNNMIHLIGN